MRLFSYLIPCLLNIIILQCVAVKRILIILNYLEYWFSVALEQSIGAVVKYQPAIAEISRSPEFLLLRNRRGFWGFPQGHKEKGETEIQTLTREVAEETGIKYLDIQAYIGKIHYSYFRSDGMKSEKEVRFYYATTPIKEVRISEEHDAYTWASFSDALMLIDHRQLKLILIKGHRKGLY
jgi:8-oxo-dGTP pyrophosphatase MutT (NUDIX family)